MLSAHHFFQVGFQLSVLLLTGVGWGYWILRLVRRRSVAAPISGDILLCGIAGLCLCFIILQNLVYTGIWLERSAWFGLLISAGGIVHWWRSQPERKNIMGSIRSLVFSTWFISGLTVFCFQSVALLYRGPSNYYGNAHQDQVNYVQLAQFLIEKPFGTTLRDVKLDPWLVKAIDLKNMRITQSVANGYVAVTTLTDAKVAYGTTSILFVGLLASVTTTLLGNCGLEKRLAWLGGVWSGVLPAVTQTHLDGFFSQTSILFVLPALCASLVAARRNLRLSWVTSTLFLTFLLGAYTEVYIIGAAFVFVLSLTLVGWSLRKRLGYAVTAITVPLVLLIPYVVRSFIFVMGQYKIASNPESLAELAPHAGTWQGWVEIFANISSTNPSQVRVQMLAGFCLFGFMFIGLFSRSFSRRFFFTGMIATPLGILAVILSAPVLAKYPFGKLLTIFAPLAVVFSVIGMARFGPLIITGLLKPRLKSGLTCPPYGTILHPLALLITGIFAVTAASSSMAKLRQVIAGGDNLPALSSSATQAVFREIESHPTRTYLLKEQHVILNAWLSFYARHAQVYADVNIIGDRAVPVDQFEFRHIPRNLGEVWLLTGEGIKSYAEEDGSPEIIVRNSQGIDRDGILTWYWIGDEMKIEIVSFSQHAKSQNINLRAISGPANDAKERTVSLLQQNTGRKQTREFTQDAHLEFSVDLQPGSNFFVLRVEAPTEWQYHLPGDARKLMVRVQELGLSSVANKTPVNP